MNTFHLTISAPDGERFSGKCLSLTVRGVEGELAVLAGHAPFVTSLQPGDCTLRLADDTIRRGRAEGGLLSVSRDAVTLLSGSFRFCEEADNDETIPR